jgi:Helix-hairpin-helix motif
MMGLAIVAERERAGAYRSFDDFVERLRGAPVGARAVRNLVMVGAFDAFGSPRRQLLWGWQERWDGRGLRRGVPAQSELRLPSRAPSLPGLTELETTRLEYRISDLSTGRHLVHFYRDRLQALGAAHPRRPRAGARRIEAMPRESGWAMSPGGRGVTEQGLGVRIALRLVTPSEVPGLPAWTHPASRCAAAVRRRAADGAADRSCGTSPEQRLTQAPAFSTKTLAGRMYRRTMRSER